MDYKKLAKSAFKNAAKFRDAGDVSMAVDILLYWRAITDLLARAEAAEERCKELETKCKRLDEARERANEAEAKWEGMYRMALDRAEKAEETTTDLCDDFTDFVTGGVHNAAPYCANRRQECVNAHGWCDGDNRVCRGFMPKAAIGRKEE